MIAEYISCKSRDGLDVCLTVWRDHHGTVTIIQERGNAIMNYAKCPTCKHSMEIRRTFTGREYFMCPNIQCHNYGAQGWVPEPIETPCGSSRSSSFARSDGSG